MHNGIPMRRTNLTESAALRGFPPGRGGPTRRRCIWAVFVLVIKSISRRAVTDDSGCRWPEIDQDTGRKGENEFGRSVGTLVYEYSATSVHCNPPTVCGSLFVCRRTIDALDSEPKGVCVCESERCFPLSHV